MGIGSSTLPCMKRDSGKEFKSMKPSAERHKGKIRQVDESQEYFSSAAHRIVKMDTASMDLFFQSTSRNPLMHRYCALSLTQYPGEEAKAVLLCSAQEAQEDPRYSVASFSFFGGQASTSLEHAVNRYLTAQRLEAVGGACDGSGIYLLFRVAGYTAQRVVREMPPSTTALELETYLNAQLRERLCYRYSLLTRSALFIVLAPTLDDPAVTYMVLEVSSHSGSLLQRAIDDIEKNFSNSRMTLVGLVTAGSSLLLVYTYA